MKRASSLAVWLCIAAIQPARAGLIEVTATQTGGFYDGGGIPDNFPEFQNYYVGYGTTPGFTRTTERRSFFVFDLVGITPGEVVSAALTLRLPFGGLKFGKSGDPTAGPVPSPDDLSEVFALGVTTIATATVLSLGLTPPEIDLIFESFNDIPVALPYVFSSGSVPPPEPDGFGAKIVIPFSAMGITALDIKAGSTIVLTGWMPSWTFDSRLEPGGGPTDYYEASELIFGLTDVHFPPPPGVPPPVLTMLLADDTAVVPEPSSMMLFAMGVGGLAVRKMRRRRPSPD
jgi:hypothetical protein